MGGPCSCPTPSTGRANPPSGLWTSVTHTVIRPRRSFSLLLKVCTLDSSSIAVRRLTSPSATFCLLVTCPREPLSATSRRRPEIVASLPGPAVTTPPSLPTTPTPRGLGLSCHLATRKLSPPPTGP